MIVCLALILVRVAERETDKSWNKLKDTFEDNQVGEFISNSGKFKMRTDLTKEQAGNHAIMGVDEPPSFLKMEPNS